MGRRIADRRSARALAGPLLATMVGITLLAQPTWRPQRSGVDARLRGISAVNERVAWASGTNGTVLRTINGGETWERLHVPGAESLDFRDIDAINENVAYVLSIGNGPASRIYKTEDAGRRWTLQFHNTDERIFLDAMAFWSADHGIAFSDSVDGRFVIFMTTNGRTWERLPVDRLPPALPNEGAYAASGTNIAIHGDNVWIGTTASRVLHSPDRGRRWTVATTPIPTGESAGIFSIAFRDARHGIVVGGDYRKESEAIDNAAVTSDGGRTWTLSRNLSGYRSVVAYLPGSRGSWIAIGPRGADITEDDGRRWTPLMGPGFHTFSFAPGTRTGWAAGEKGSIARLEWR